MPVPSTRRARRPRRPRRRDVAAAALAAAALLVALAACDNAGPPATTGPTPAPGELTACDLLSAQELREIMGTDELVPVVAVRTETETFCSYRLTDETGIATSSYQSSGGVDDLALYRASPGAVELPGIADGAVLVELRDLYVLKGDTLFGFSPLKSGYSDAELQNIADRVAAAVVPRLP